MLQKRNGDTRQCSQYVAEQMREMSFTCTRPDANMAEVTNARSRDDHEIKANKSADFADRLFSYTASAQKYPVYSPVH